MFANPTKSKLQCAILIIVDVDILIISQIQILLIQNFVWVVMTVYERRMHFVTIQSSK